jgi:hypothetical protein
LRETAKAKALFYASPRARPMCRGWIGDGHIMTGGRGFVFYANRASPWLPTISPHKDSPRHRRLARMEETNRA